MYFMHKSCTTYCPVEIASYEKCKSQPGFGLGSCKKTTVAKLRNRDNAVQASNWIE